jgi:hypothetical protein
MGFQNPYAGGRSAVGGALSFAFDNLYSGSSSMWGPRVMVGADLKHQATTGFTYSGDLFGGVANYLTHRYIAFPSASVSTSSGTTGYGSVATPSESTQGGNNIAFVGGSFRVDKDLYFRRGLHVKPYVSLNETYLTTGINNESGAGALDLVGATRGDVYMTLEPGVELGGLFTSRNGQLRPHVDIWTTQFIGRNLASFTAGLAGAPPYLQLPFSSAIDRTTVNVAPSLDISGYGGLDLRFSGGFQFSSHLHSGSFSINLSQQTGPKPQR